MKTQHTVRLVMVCAGLSFQMARADFVSDADGIPMGDTKETAIVLNSGGAYLNGLCLNEDCRWGYHGVGGSGDHIDNFNHSPFSGEDSEITRWFVFNFRPNEQALQNGYQGATDSDVQQAPPFNVRGIVFGAHVLMPDQFFNYVDLKITMFRRNSGNTAEVELEELFEENSVNPSNPATMNYVPGLERLIYAPDQDSRRINTVKRSSTSPISPQLDYVNPAPLFPVLNYGSQYYFKVTVKFRDKIQLAPNYFSECEKCQANPTDIPLRIQFNTLEPSHCGNTPVNGKEFSLQNDTSLFALHRWSPAYHYSGTHSGRSCDGDPSFHDSMAPNPPSGSGTSYSFYFLPRNPELNPSQTGGAVENQCSSGGVGGLDRTDLQVLPGETYEAKIVTHFKMRRGDGSDVDINFHNAESILCKMEFYKASEHHTAKVGNWHENDYPASYQPEPGSPYQSGNWVPVNKPATDQLDTQYGVDAWKIRVLRVAPSKDRETEGVFSLIGWFTNLVNSGISTLTQTQSSPPVLSTISEFWHYKANDPAIGANIQKEFHYLNLRELMSYLMDCNQDGLPSYRFSDPGQIGTCGVESNQTNLNEGVTIGIQTLPYFKIKTEGQNALNNLDPQAGFQICSNENEEDTVTICGGNRMDAHWGPILYIRNIANAGNPVERTRSSGSSDQQEEGTDDGKQTILDEKSE